MDDLLTQGIAAVKAGKIEEARKLLDAAIRAAPDDERTWGWFYNICLNDKERIRCIKEILRINPNNENAKKKYDELVGLSFQSSPDPAATKLPPISGSINDTISVQTLKCPMCGANIKQFDRECNYCGSTLMIVSVEKTLSSKIDINILTSSVSKWKNVLKNDLNNPEANYGLGLTYLHQRLRDAALEHLRKASFLSPESPIIHYNLALSLFNDGQTNINSEDYDNSIKEIGYALILDPNFREAKAFKHFFTARKLDAINEGEAIKEYEAAIQECSDIAVLHNNLGLAYYKLKQYSLASRCYLKAIEIDPEFSTAYSNLCLISFDTGKYSDGIAYGRKAIEVIRPTETNDNQAFPYNNLALCLWKMGQRDEAIHMLQRAVALQPNNPLFKTNLSNIQNQSITSWGNVGKLIALILVFILILIIVLAVLPK